MSKVDDLEILTALLSGKSANDTIRDIEEKGHKNILDEILLPIYANSINHEHFYSKDEKNKEKTLKKYEELKIEIIGEKDDLFYRVKLPKNIKIIEKGSVYWTYLTKENEEIASIFFKAVFYDRDAFINICW